MQNQSIWHLPNTLTLLPSGKGSTRFSSSTAPWAATERKSSGIPGVTFFTGL